MADDDYLEPEDHQAIEVGNAQDTVRAWLDGAWTETAARVRSRDETVTFAGTYAEWEQLVVALRVLAGGMEPERHFGVLHIVGGGDTDG